MEMKLPITMSVWIATPFKHFASRVIGAKKSSARRLTEYSSAPTAQPEQHGLEFKTSLTVIAPHALGIRILLGAPSTALRVQEARG
jgi:hypothetical protein